MTRDEARSREELLAELAELRRRVDELEHVERRAQRDRYDREFLARTALELAAFPAQRDNIYDYLAERLRELVDTSIVLVLAFDQDSGVLVCRAVVGLGNRSRAILELVGRNPIGMRFTVRRDQDRQLRQGRLRRVSGGLFEFAQGQISKRACTLITRLLGLGEIYSLGIARAGQLFAHVAILTRGDHEIADAATLETFAAQASVALRSRQAERFLSAQEELCSTLFEMLSANVLLLDGEGLITRTNGRTAGFYGYQNESVLTGTRFTDLIAAPDRNRVSELLANVAETGRTVTVECTFVARTGKQMPGELSSAAITDEHDQAKGIMVIANGVG